MKVFISASPQQSQRLSEWVQDALGNVLLLRPEDIALIHHDSRYGPKVQPEARAQISDADLVVADLSGAHPTVHLEVGLALGLQKPTVVLVRDSSDISPDLRHTMAVFVPSGASESYMSTRLGDAIKNAIAHPVDDEGQGFRDRLRPDRKKLFISYSHRDREYLDRILVHLRPLERAGYIELWSDTRLRPGDQWRAEIRSAVHESGVALLLISADFLASDFIATDELPPLLAAAEERGTQIIPIIVKPSRFSRDGRLSRFQAMNDPANPIIRMSEADREELFAKVAETIELGLGLEGIELQVV